MITKRNKRNKNRDIRKKRTRRNHKKKAGGSGKMTSDELREANLRMMKEALGEVNKPRKRKVEKVEEVVPLPEAPKIQPIVIEETLKVIEEPETKKRRKKTPTFVEEEKVTLLIEKGMDYPRGSLQRAFSKYTIEDVEPMELRQLHEIYKLWRREETSRRKGHRMEKRGHTNTAPWSNEEENQLIDLAARYGHNWVEISAIMGDRSPHNIRNYWNKNLKGDYDKAEDLHKPKTQSVRTKNAKTKKA